MKALLIIFVLFITTDLVAQDTLNQSTIKGKARRKSFKLYGIMGALGPGVAYLPNYSGSGEMNVHFVYATKDAAGNWQQQTFDETFKVSFLQQTNFFLNLATFEIGRYRSYISCSIDYNLTGKGIHFAFGYGRNIYLGHNGYRLEERVTRCKFVFKPSISITNYMYTKCKIGSIDNHDVDILFLDHYVSTTIPRSYGTPLGASTDHINVYFMQNGLGFQPKLSISTNPYRTRMHIGVFTSCFIPISENSELSFSQIDTDGNDHTISTEELDTKGIEIKYNNQPVTSTPFHLSNVYIGCTVGVNFSEKK